MAQVLRRMVFLSSQNLIQSEAVLRPAPPLPPSAAASAAASKKGAASRRPAGGAKGAEAPPAPVPLEVDFSQLPCGYHTAIIAGLALIGAPHPRVVLGLKGWVVNLNQAFRRSHVQRPSEFLKLQYKS